MAFFRKKTQPQPPSSLQQVVRERVLTAEGWRRRMEKLKQISAAKSKSAK